MRLENFFTYYKKELIARQTAVEQAILQGVSDWDEYKYLTGKVTCFKTRSTGTHGPAKENGARR